MKNYRIEAAILAVGLALAGLFVYCGFKAFSQRDRVVSVRGLSERESTPTTSSGPSLIR